MKSSWIIPALLICIVAFIAYQFIFADRRSKLTVGEDAHAWEMNLPPTEQASVLEMRAPEEGFIDPVMQPLVERKIIKTGDISFETDNVVDTKTSITKMVTELEGYVSNDQVSDFSDRIHHRMSIRVAADKFDRFVEQVAQLAKKLEHKSITTEDVTEEYIDVEARLKTKKELESRYRELLGKANKVEEILAIEREIGTLRSDIESIEGRLRYLKDRVAYSTLNITFYQLKTTSFGFGSRIGEALGSGWTSLLTFLIALTGAWPFILILGAVIYLVRRKIWPKKNQAPNS